MREKHFVFVEYLNRENMNWKKFLVNVLPVIMILGLASCFNDDDNDTFSVQADVYYINKLVDTQWVHGTTYYVYNIYGSQAISSAKVTTPASETINLEQAVAYYNVFVNSPDDEDYSTAAPEEGNFLFEVTSSKGEVLNVSDAQEFVNLEGAAIDSIKFDNSNSGMKIFWNEIDDADGYHINMYDSSDNLIFESYSIAPDYTELLVSPGVSTGSWNTSPKEGQEYTVLLQTFVYDDDADKTNYPYSIKEISIRDTTVTWQF